MTNDTGRSFARGKIPLMKRDFRQLLIIGLAALLILSVIMWFAIRGPESYGPGSKLAPPQNKGAASSKTEKQ
jgi:hypothetical protein